jgi:CubicO group peptidase (beta-lactamase class C family)
MAAAIVPGLSIAVVKDGTLLWRRGFGVKDTASKEAVDTDTVFEAQSMSKPVFAYAVMQLCDRGAMNLDAPLTKHTRRRILEGDQRLDLITARHVLSHTAGFQNWRSQSNPLRIQSAPGEKYQYSGEGYSWLQSIVTELTGEVNLNQCRRYEVDLEVCATDIDAYMTANIFAPFGMTSTGYVWDDRFTNHARPHDPKGQPRDKGHPTATDAARYAAAGGLHTTATDYARFMIEVLDPKGSGKYQLKKETIDEMTRPQVKMTDANSWALGWAIQHTPGRDFIFHGGDIDGFHSMAVASVPSRSGYVIMTNGENGIAVIQKLITGATLSQLL